MWDVCNSVKQKVNLIYVRGFSEWIGKRTTLLTNNYEFIQAMSQLAYEVGRTDVLVCYGKETIQGSSYSEHYHHDSLFV